MDDFPQITHFNGLRGGAVGGDTALYVERLTVRFPIVTLEFFTDIIHPAALWPLELNQPLTEMSARNISLGVKAAGTLG